MMIGTLGGSKELFMRHGCLRGFTLIEILVVVVILSIAALIVVPGVGSQQDSLKLTASTRMVMADLFYAQNYAITNQTPVYVRFYYGSTGVNGFDISSTNSAINTSSPITDCLAGPDGGRMRIRFGSGVSGPFSATRLGTLTAPTGFTPASAPLLFTSDGQPSSSTTTPLTDVLSIPITNTNGTSTMTLVLQPFTGEISIQ